MLQFLPIIGTVIGQIIGVIEKAVPDKELQEKIKAEVLLKTLEQSNEEFVQRAKIVQAEARSEHWLTASWRPILMLSFTFIIVHNYILAPYLQVFFGIHIVLDMPEHFWNLLTIGVGGYVVGRSAEKVADKISNKLG